MEVPMNPEELAKIVKEAAVEIEGKQRLTCGKAFQLVEKYAVTPKEIGECCNINKVKIVKCQLGCFE